MGQKMKLTASHTSTNEHTIPENSISSSGVYCGSCNTPIVDLGKNENQAESNSNESCHSCNSFDHCCDDRNISYCFQCNIYPCTKFKSMAVRWKQYGQNLKFNQKLLEVMGERYFLEYYNKLFFKTNSIQ